MDDPQPLPLVEIVSEGQSVKRVPDKGPRASGSDLRDLVRFVYTNNPFYVISAGLVFWGLRLSFNTRGEAFETWALMGGLAGYTVLLAAAAWLLIRVGKVWDDVRSLLLLVVLMLLAMSVSFDDTLAADSRRGAVLFAGGFAFAVALTEALLRGLRLRLPALFRVPYYLWLALFFFYPVALSPWIRDTEDPALYWGLFGFCPAAGLILLSLLPAVRRGPQYVRDNGSPWPWPWYPWVLFGVLAVAACGRSYYLCISLHFVGGKASIFGFYFWIPLLFAANVLLLEIGIVSRLKGVTLAALIAPVVAVALAAAAPDHAKADLGFLEMFTKTLGASPLFLTLVASAVLYLVAAVRRVAYAADALSVALAALIFCGPATLGVHAPVEPRAWPLLAIAALQGGIGWYRGSAARLFIALSCLLGTATLQFRGTAFTAHRGLIPSHLQLAIILVVGAAFRNAFGRAMQHLGAALILLTAAAALQGSPRWLADLPPALSNLYPAMMILLAVGYGFLVGNRWYYAAAAGSLGCWAAVHGGWSYAAARRKLPGLDYIVSGALFFLLAMFISLIKAGLPQRWLADRRKRISEPDPE